MGVFFIGLGVALILGLFVAGGAILARDVGWREVVVSAIVTLGIISVITAGVAIVGLGVAML